jgi:hypothetical protein
MFQTHDIPCGILWVLCGWIQPIKYQKYLEKIASVLYMYHFFFLLLSLNIIAQQCLHSTCIVFGFNVTYK